MATIAADKLTKKDTQEYLIRATILERGWTDKLLKLFLAEPDKTAPNPHYRSAARMKLYLLERIEKIEQTQTFKEELEKANKRKLSAKRALETKKKNLEILLEQQRQQQIKEEIEWREKATIEVKNTLLILLEEKKKPWELPLFFTLSKNNKKLFNRMCTLLPNTEFGDIVQKLKAEVEMIFRKQKERTENKQVLPVMNRLKYMKKCIKQNKLIKKNKKYSICAECGEEIHSDYLSKFFKHDLLTLFLALNIMHFRHAHTDYNSRLSTVERDDRDGYYRLKQDINENIKTMLITKYRLLLRFLRITSKHFGKLQNTTHKTLTLARKYLEV